MNGGMTFFYRANDLMMSLALSLRLRSFRSFHDCVVRSLSTTRHEDSEQRLLAKIAAQVNAKKLVKGGNASALHRQVAATSYSGSFAVVELNTILERCKLWNATFPRVQPYYPIKVNPDRALLSLTAGMGCGFDVASATEIQLALDAGVDPGEIIFSHTMKLRSDMRMAKDQQIGYSTVDSEEELRKHAEIWPEAKLLLRIAPKLGVGRDLGYRFGCTLNEAEDLLRLAHQLGLDMVGVHFHVGCLATDARAYQDAIKQARAVFDMCNTMRFLNIGGGFSCPSDRYISSAKHDFLTLASSINNALDECFPADSHGHVTFMAEPGTFLSMAGTSIATEVVGVRKVYNVQCDTMIPDLCLWSQNGCWVSDSTYGNLAIFNWQGFSSIAELSVQVVRKVKEHDKVQEQERVVSAASFVLQGITCDWADTVHKGLRLPPLEEQDLVVFGNMGAYCQACSVDFNGFAFASLPTLYLYVAPLTHPLPVRCTPHACALFDFLVRAFGNEHTEE